MDMKKKHIRSECRLLVESILSANLVDANGLLKRLLNRIEDMREDNAISLVMEQDDGSAPADADTDLTEAEEGGEGETGGEGNDLGDDLAEVQGDGEAAEAEGDDEEEDKLRTVSGTRKSEAEVNSIGRNLGLPVGDEDLQSYIIKEEQKNGC